MSSRPVFEALGMTSLFVGVASLALRPASTMRLSCHLVDVSGDVVYQLSDACFFAMALWLRRLAAGEAHAAVPFSR